MLRLNTLFLDVYTTHCRTSIRIQTRIPYTVIRDLSLDLCNVNFQHITIVAKGKPSESKSESESESSNVNQPSEVDST